MISRNRDIHLNHRNFKPERVQERNYLSWETLGVAGFISAVFGAIGAGTAIYGAATAPGAPGYMPPPPPPNSTIYDEDGGILSRQVFDKEKNEWITYGANSEPQKPASEWATKISAVAPEVPSTYDAWNGGLLTRGSGDEASRIRANFEKDMTDPVIKAEVERRFQEHVTNDPKGVAEHSSGWRFEEYQNMLNDVPKALEQYKTESADYEKKLGEWTTAKEARAAEKAKLAELRGQALDNLNEASPERQAQIEKFGTAYADSMHRDVDPRFQKIDRGVDEDMNAKGMTGSRAYVDLKSELATDKSNQDTDIANQSTMAKEALTSGDRAYWANLLNQIDSGARSDSITQSTLAKNNSDITNQNYAGMLGYNSAQNANKLGEWETKQRLSSSYVNAGSNLAGGLLYLYGNKGGTFMSPSSSGGGGSNPGVGISAIKPTKTSAGTFSLV